MKQLRKLLVLIAVLCFIPGIVGAQELNPILVYVKGEPIEFTEESQMLARDGRICLPVRKISEKMDYKVDWNDKDRAVTLTNGEKTVTVRVDKNEYTANGEKKTMDVAPFIKNNRTYLPMRFIGEALGEKVEWDEANRVAIFGEYPINQKVDGETIQISPNAEVTIPKDLKDKVIYGRDKDMGLVLFEKQNHETQWNGMLGNFVLVDYPEHEVPCYLVGKVDGKYLMFYYVSDVQCDINNEALVKAYQEARERVPEIVSTVQIAK
ncbi:MAG: copper amine oxidase N-terminal domain-containing protein [Peptoniphilus sp.]|nr:copper amine oxidase N-terminal domain-containing protein [Peptoniphilus sp.]MDD7363770.1 copper amine oxidase N-terminal domain-containing protein [Bacillota bacterium]MDY6044611.1 copper amine oxidase N-terminal domain-containing protein [Peptoniphilus sp.]